MFRSFWVCLAPRLQVTVNERLYPGRQLLFYTMVKKQVEYDETLWAQRDAEREKRFEARLKRQAQQLGYKLVPIEEKPAA